jgi:hypothetical protein
MDVSLAAQGCQIARSRRSAPCHGRRPGHAPLHHGCRTCLQAQPLHRKHCLCRECIVRGLGVDLRHCGRPAGLLGHGPVLTPPFEESGGPAPGGGKMGTPQRGVWEGPAQRARRPNGGSPIEKLGGGGNPGPARRRKTSRDHAGGCRMRGCVSGGASRELRGGWRAAERSIHALPPSIWPHLLRFGQTAESDFKLHGAVMQRWRPSHPQSHR